MRPYRKGALASLALLALLAPSIDGICGGWEPSSQARDACCEMAGHDFHGDAADDCCAAGEERQHGQTSSAAPSLAPASSTLAVSTIDSLGARSFWPLDETLDRSRSSTVTRLLHCVFLI